MWVTLSGFPHLAAQQGMGGLFSSATPVIVIVVLKASQEPPWREKLQELP
jgi:hypothetical protein